MFSDQTNALIDEALSSRQGVVDARTAAAEKTSARTTAAAEEATALQTLQAAQQSATQARDAALRAITDELNVPAEGAAAALQQRQQAPQGYRPAAGQRR